VQARSGLTVGIIEERFLVASIRVESMVKEVEISDTVIIILPKVLGV
jgi:hypothetical protein